MAPNKSEIDKANKERGEPKGKLLSWKKGKKCLPRLARPRSRNTNREGPKQEGPGRGQDNHNKKSKNSQNTEKRSRNLNGNKLGAVLEREGPGHLETPRVWMPAPQNYLHQS